MTADPVLDPIVALGQLAARAELLAAQPNTTPSRQWLANRCAVAYRTMQLRYLESNPPRTPGEAEPSA